MNIQDYGAIGEIVGGIAVIATLLYLSIQIRQSNISTHRNMYAQAATAISDYWLTLAQNPELYELFVTLLRFPERLEEQELERGYLVLDSYLSLMESYYLHNNEYEERLSQERWERILKRLLNSPGGKSYWPRRLGAFHEEFANYIESIIDVA